MYNIFYHQDYDVLLDQDSERGMSQKVGLCLCPNFWVVMMLESKFYLNCYDDNLENFTYIEIKYRVSLIILNSQNFTYEQRKKLHCESSQFIFECHFGEDSCWSSPFI